VGGIRYAFGDLSVIPENSFGFHGGRVGIAYAAAAVGRLLERPELLAEAETILRASAGKESEDRGIDVIGGAGGAIPALVALSAWLPDGEVAMEMARRLGDHLIAQADREPEGWAWGTMRGSAIRHLCGYAHGSAGVGHALLELYLATGDSRYRYAMEQAFLYEDPFFDAESSNWPDLRHNELGELLYSGRQDQLKDRLLAGGTLAPQPMRYMAAWCHGAPGIGLSRLRAWQTLGDPHYLGDVQAAVKATFESLDEPRMNYSLCHGRAGNAETLIEAAGPLGRPELLDRVKEVALEGWREYEAQGRPWPCGTMQSATDPGLLLGESGIAYWLLRLADPSTPSVLLVVPPESTRRADDGGEGHRAQLGRAVDEYFSRSIHLFDRLGAGGPLPSREPGAPERADVLAAREALEARVRAEADPARRALLDDALRLDRERLSLALSVTDFTEEYLENLVRAPEPEVRWGEARIALTPRARVVHGERDWEAWLEDEDAAEPEEADVFYLLQASARRVAVRRLSPFAALVLQAVETPATLDEVVSRVREAVSADGGGPSREWLEDRVTEQLRQAYRAGFVTAENALAAAAA
jgi:hypothetical protein